MEDYVVALKKGTMVENPFFVSSQKVILRGEIALGEEVVSDFAISIPPKVLLGIESCVLYKPLAYDVLVPRSLGTVDYIKMNEGENWNHYLDSNQELNFETMKSSLFLSKKIFSVLDTVKNSYNHILLMKNIMLGVMGYLDEKESLFLSNPFTNSAMSVHEEIKERNLVNLLYPFSEKILKISTEELEQVDLFRETPYTVFRFLAFYPDLLKRVDMKFIQTERVFFTFGREESLKQIDNFFYHLNEFFGSYLDEFQELISPNGIFHTFIHLRERVKTDESLNYLQKLCEFCLVQMGKELGTTVKHISPMIAEKFKGLLIQCKEKIAKRVVINLNSNKHSTGNMAEFQEFVDLKQRLLDISSLTAEEKESFNRFFNEWGLNSYSMSVEEGIRKIRNALNERFWLLYTNIVKKVITQEIQLDLGIEAFLEFGVLDEKLVSYEALKAIKQLLQNKSTTNKLQIFTLVEWMQKIVKKEVAPSFDAGGTSYQQTLELKVKESRKEPTPENVAEIDTIDMRIDYELSIIKECAKIVSGQVLSYSPILTAEILPTEISKAFFQKKYFEQEFLKIKAIDFTIFYQDRFLNLQMSDGNVIQDIVKTEVLPYIILLPNWGKKGIVWQVKAKEKNSPGRLFFPMTQTSEFSTAVIETFGTFRWEYLKEILGPLWNDLSQFSLTAEYMDYLMTYKKSRDLYSEQKEKLNIHFKKIRLDRDKFLYDYKVWIKNDTKGRNGTNKVVKGIFYKHIPFPLALREQLKSTPIYEELNNRYINLTTKEYNRVRLKFKRYESTPEGIPQEVKDYLSFIVS